MQFQDAETLRPNSGEGGALVAWGPSFLSLYRDSANGIGGVYNPIIGASGRLGIVEGIDVGGAAWVSNFPFFLAFAQAYDLGLKADIKRMITPRAWQHKLAFIVGISGYYAINGSFAIDGEQEGYGGTWSYAPGVIYSYAWGDTIKSRSHHYSLYAGLRVERAASSYFYMPRDTVRAHAGESDHTRISATVWNPFIGLRVGELFVETSAIFVPDPLTGKNRWGMYVGLRLPGMIE
jgi:hypothetical protein